MRLTEVLPILAICAAVFFIVVVTLYDTGRGETLVAMPWWFPAGLSAAFFGWTVWTISREGLWAVWLNHTTNMWGNQVWFDLLFAVSIGWWLALPRIRAAGMNVWGWLLFVVATASIGFLAMIARLLYLAQCDRR